jgi:hypothetical protein
MSGDNRGLPQDVTFTNITQDQVRSLEATFTKSAAFDGAAVSFREQTQADGSLTLSVHFMPLPGAPSTATPQSVAPGGQATVAGSLVGFDAARDCGRFADRIKAANVDFVARYYSHTVSKNLSASEAQLLSRVGLKLVAVWESQGDHVSFFTRLQGVDDGTSAYNLAMQVGQPSGSPIYFGVDCDPLQQDVAAAIIPYFQGVAAGFNTMGHGSPAYAVGVYGSGLVCSTLMRMGLATHTWLANAMGWQGSRTYQDWQIKQHLPGDPFSLGFQVDPDDARPEFGGFTVAPLVA